MCHPFKLSSSYIWCSCWNIRLGNFSTKVLTLKLLYYTNFIITPDGVPLVCGGLGVGPDEFSNDCYALKDKSWVKTTKLKLGRAYAALAKLDDEQVIISLM